MRNLLLALITLLPLVVNAAGISLPSTSNDIPHSVSQSKHLPKFDAIEDDGHFVLDITAGTKQSSVKLIGDAHLVNNLEAVVSDHTLYLHCKEDATCQKRETVVAVIRTPHLTHITHHGDGDINATGINTDMMGLDITGNSNIHLHGKIGLTGLNVTGRSRVKITGLKSDHLIVDVSNHAHVDMQGEARLQSITAKDHAWLSIHWVDSPDVHISQAEHSFVQLAGTAGTVTADLSDKACLDAKYLRSQLVYVDTHDKAVAKMSPLDSLNALAAGRSNIYYYSMPTFVADYMTGHGSVLDMSGIQPKNGWLVLK